MKVIEGWLEQGGTSSGEGLGWLPGTCEGLPVFIHGIGGGGSRQPLSKASTGAHHCCQATGVNLMLKCLCFLSNWLPVSRRERHLALLLGGKGQFQYLPSQTLRSAAEVKCTALSWHKSPHILQHQSLRTTKGPLMPGSE